MRRTWSSLVWAGWGALVLVTGCARLPLDHDMRTTYGLTPEMLRQVQVYTSDDIVLERRVERRSAEPTPDRALLLRETELIRRVYIPRGTPGVIVDAYDDRLDVQFEPGGATLTFGSTKKNREKLGGLYNLMANRWENGRGTLVYDGEIFQTQPGAGAVHLLVNARDIERTKVVRKTVRGMYANQPPAPIVSPPLTEEERAKMRGP